MTLISFGVCKKDEEMFNANLEYMGKMFHDAGVGAQMLVISDGVEVSTKVSVAFRKTLVQSINLAPLKYPAVANAMFLAAAMRCLHENCDMLWMEPDAMILTPHAMRSLTVEADLRGRSKVILPRVNNGPFDLCTGIGYYPLPVMASWIAEIVSTCPHTHGWDGWMFEQYPNTYFLTDKIFHRYGNYDERGIAHNPHITTDTLRTIRDNGALIYHKIWEPETFKLL